MNRPSTGFELVGFALLAFAAWLVTPVAGLAVGGVSALIIGFSFEDDRSLIALRRITASAAYRRQLRRSKRAARRAERSQKAS